MLLVTVINVTSTPDIMVLRIALRASRVFRAHGSGNVIVYSEYASSAIWLILRPVALEAGSPKPFSRVFFFFFLRWSLFFYHAFFVNYVGEFSLFFLFFFFFFVELAPGGFLCGFPEAVFPSFFFFFFCAEACLMTTRF